jgi:hypothetical protein
VLGDSIDSGTGNLPAYDHGWTEYALNGHGLGVARMSRPGERLQDIIGISGRDNRLAYLAPCTDVILSLGINDLFVTAGSVTLAQMQGFATTVIGLLTRRGLRVWLATLLPHTTSTDNWATTANQAPYNADHAAGGLRSQYNDWLRTVPAGAFGLIERADAVESARNSGLWKTFPRQRALPSSAMTHNSTTLTCATGDFTSADIDASVTVPGANNGPLNTTIASVTNSTTVVLRDVAQADVSGVAAAVMGYTTDGLHPTLIGHEALAATVPLSSIQAP